MIKNDAESIPDTCTDEEANQGSGQDAEEHKVSPTHPLRRLSRSKIKRLLSPKIEPTMMR